MRLRETPLAGLLLMETAPIRDERGQFDRVFCETQCSELRPNLHWTQINVSTTAHLGTIRGMHFQYPPAAEAKLIRCLRGRVFDVAVDVRAGSPTFLRWHGVELSERKPLQVFIPEGFAHGFQTLENDCELLYLHSAPYNPESEGGINPSDPLLNIKWPLQVLNMSQRDRERPFLTESFEGISV